MKLRLRSVDVVWRQLDGEAILLDLRSSQYLRINGTGAVVLDALRDGAAPEELTRALLDEFEVSEKQARADVDRFLSSLGAADLLVEGEGQP